MKWSQVYHVRGRLTGVDEESEEERWMERSQRTKSGKSSASKERMKRMWEIMETSEEEGSERGSNENEVEVDGYIALRREDGGEESWGVEGEERVGIREDEYMKGEKKRKAESSGEGNERKTRKRKRRGLG